MDGADAVRYCVENKIPGVFVECGCGNGNFQICWINELNRLNEVREFVMYDTFAGLTAPSEKDFTVKESNQYTMTKDQVRSEWQSKKVSETVNTWCNWSLGTVKQNLAQYPYDHTKLTFIVGDVRETLLKKENLPEQIAMLRLDTDWYDSSKIELEQLYPRVVPGGLVIFDDYYHWNGQQQATDEYLATLNPKPILVNVNDKVAALIKPKDIPVTPIQSMQQVLETNHVTLHNNKIVIPEEVKHIKLDVGLSYGANMSQEWLTHEKDLVVFGFEPNPEAVRLLRSEHNPKQHPAHADVIEPRFIDTQFFILPIALGATKEADKDFYITTLDQGCSSFYKPSGVLFDVSNVIKVPVFPLKDFLDHFPWDQFPYIEYLKIDAQGSDLDIIRGIDPYLDRFVFITTEATVGNLYLNVKDNEVSKVDAYMMEKGFFRVIHPMASDATYLNYKFRDIAPNIYIFQNG
jgi:O-methyltransferase